MAQSLFLGPWFSLEASLIIYGFFASGLNLTVMVLLLIIIMHLSYRCGRIFLFNVTKGNNLLIDFLATVVFNSEIWGWAFLTGQSLIVGVDARRPWRKRMGIQFEDRWSWFLESHLRPYIWLLWVILKVLLYNWGIEKAWWFDKRGIEPNIVFLIHSIKIIA